MNETASQEHSEGPPTFYIQSRDWWVKVLGMLQQNWALVEASGGGRATVYFFHDQGFTKSGDKRHKLSMLRNRIAVVDSLEFATVDEAKMRLAANGFERLEDCPEPDGEQPEGVFYDARATESGIYSKDGHWV